MHDPELVAFYATFEKLFNAGDLDGLLALYEPDAVLVAGPGQHVDDAAGRRAALAGFLALKGRIRLEIRHLLRNGDIALLSNAWRLEASDAAGAPLVMTGRTSEVARRQPDGSWRYVIDHPNGAEG